MFVAEQICLEQSHAESSSWTVSAYAGHWGSNVVFRPENALIDYYPSHGYEMYGYDFSGYNIIMKKRVTVFIDAFDPTF